MNRSSSQTIGTANLPSHALLRVNRQTRSSMEIKKLELGGNILHHVVDAPKLLRFESLGHVANVEVIADI